MRALFRKIRDMRFQHEPLITVIIHRDRILHNLREFQKSVPAVAPVLKANAYGHGLVQVAQILESGHLPFFCVDSYVEAMILRNEGIKTPLLIIGYTPLKNIERSRLKNVAYGIMSMEELQRLARDCRRPTSIHLKVDTGMHRQGILLEELSEALDTLERNEKIMLEGVYSHLADADNEKSTLTEKQIGLWNAAAREARDRFQSVRWFHLSNTAGSKYAKNIDANVMRLGLGLYGIGANNLLPALEMKTRLTSVRKITVGESVGYNATFTAKNEMTVATIPVGYAEGLDRRLSNKGSATVKGVNCPFVGRVNMNITSIDVSRVPNPKLDDEVLVISSERNAPNSIENMAKTCDTIPYELLIRIPAQIRRYEE
ncbi:MAG: alanine racemase [Patescibacteria group bacterium]|nr:alanine racemase [Patescibacteria group bacterium]MDE2014967.1 alanine racemase [Patescibacteria group bacterium]